MDGKYKKTWGIERLLEASSFRPMWVRKELLDAVSLTTEYRKIVHDNGVRNTLIV